MRDSGVDNAVALIWRDTADGWSTIVDSYCERTDASYWSEPLNALSNAAFLIAAVIAWRIARAKADRQAQVLAAGAAVIGIGSYLFHTHATLWALQADVLPIRAFLLAYVAMATVRFFSAPWWAGLIASGGFLAASIPVVALATDAFGRLNGSVGYLPVPLLMVGVAAFLWRRSRPLARGLLVGAAAFTVSLLFRTIDLAACSGWPLGTHFGWHVMNGFVVGWMIVVFVNAHAAGPDRVEA